MEGLSDVQDQIMRHARQMREKDTTLVGYARVSSVEQSLDVQMDKLKHCDKIFQEKKAAHPAKDTG